MRLAFSLVGLACWMLPPAGCGDSSGGPSSGAGGDAAAGTPVTPDPCGYVSSSGNSVGIHGTWYAYGDCWGANGAPPGDCETKGMHMMTECSTIASPVPATTGDAGTDGGGGCAFPQMSGTMCLSGRAAKVIGTPSDYAYIFGIGIGLDFNNQNGVKGVWNASASHVIGFTFHLSGVPTEGVRVEFPTTQTDAMGGDSWSITASADGDYTADLTSMMYDLHRLSFSFIPTGVQPTFDPTMLKSIRIHVPTNTTAATPVNNLCISNLQAVLGTQ